MNIKKFLIYEMLFLASILLVVSTSCEKEDDDSKPLIENGNSDDNGSSDIEYGEMTDSRDDRTYKTIEIGDQVWMAENLAYLPEITYEDDWGSLTEPQYAVYGYEPGSGTETVEGAKASEHYENYGVLYNWAAAMSEAESSEENPSGVQGICPPGWHLPSDDEWTYLVDYVVEQGFPNSNVVDGVGNALKSCRQVESPLGGDCDTSEHPRWNSHDTHFGSDEFCFSALPGGDRYSNGYFYHLVSYGYWWSATEVGSNSAWCRFIKFELGGVYRDVNNKKVGFSIRCIRD